MLVITKLQVFQPTIIFSFLMFKMNGFELSNYLEHLLKRNQFYLSIQRSTNWKQLSHLRHVHIRKLWRNTVYLSEMYAFSYEANKTNSKVWNFYWNFKKLYKEINVGGANTTIRQLKFDLYIPLIFRTKTVVESSYSLNCKITGPKRKNA